MTRSKGSKNTVSLPTSYSIGDGAMNFWEAILVQAKKDADKWHYAKIMWEDYKQTDIYQRDEPRRSKGLPVNVDTGTLEAVDWWICGYVKGNWCD